MVRMCLLPELDVWYSVTKSMAILSKGCSGILSSVDVKLELLLFLCDKVDIE